MFGPEGKMENLGVRHTLPEGLYSWMARTKWWAERKNSEALCLILARGQWGAFAVHTIRVDEKNRQEHGTLTGDLFGTFA